MKFLVLLIPWSFVLAGVWAAARWLVGRRREQQLRDLLRRRLNREIDHPVTFGDDEAA